MTRRARVLAVVAVAAAMVATASTAPSFAAPTPSDTSVTGLPAEVLNAMKRDLRWDNARVERRLRAEAAAPVVERQLKAGLGAAFGGAWLPASSDRLTVAVTSASAAAQVRAAGADATVVRWGSRQLDAVKTALDKQAARAKAAQIHGWYVDVATNRVVVNAAPGATAAATAFAKAAGATAGAVSVVTSAQAPKPLYDIRGGDQYVINNAAICSIGFSVHGGFVTAGHCGGVNSNTTGYNGVSQGTFRGSSFPGNDYAWVQVNGNWNPTPYVNNYSGGSVPVAGSQAASIGSSVCRSGRTSGWRCGTVQAYNQTVNYSQGAVYEMARSNACAESGDSGGAWITGNQAQGVTSGGSGNCSVGGTTFYQPVNEILGAYGLTLATTGGGGGGGGRIISNQSNRCIDIPWGNTNDGVQLIIFDCNGGGNQNWTFEGDGTVRALGKCMDVAWGSNVDGTAIQTVNCNGSGAQKFVLSGAGDLVNPQANKCVDVRGGAGNNGDALVLWTCHGGANQKWRRG